jgi:hypothetical protein
VPGIGREENMENINLILEDVRSMMDNVNELIERAEILEKSVWEMKQLERKEKNLKKKKYYKEINEEIDFNLNKLYRKIDDFRDTELFRNKIEIPKHKK